MKITEERYRIHDMKGEREGRMLLKQTGRCGSWLPSDVASVELDEGMKGCTLSSIISYPLKVLWRMTIDEGAGHLNREPLERRRLAFRPITAISTRVGEESSSTIMTEHVIF